MCFEPGVEREGAIDGECGDEDDDVTALDRFFFMAAEGQR